MCLAAITLLGSFSRRRCAHDFTVSMKDPRFVSVFLGEFYLCDIHEGSAICFCFSANIPGGGVLAGSLSLRFCMFFCLRLLSLILFDIHRNES